jgi:hypothetical protein
MVADREFVFGLHIWVGEMSLIESTETISDEVEPAEHAALLGDGLPAVGAPALMQADEASGAAPMPGDDLPLEDRPSPHTRLGAIAEDEPALSRWIYALGAAALVVGWFVAIHVYWTPAHTGVDQNGYLLGGRMFADHLSTGFMPVDYFELVGRMWIGTPWLTYYPKYPVGLSIIYAGMIWVSKFTFARGIAFCLNSLKWGLIGVGIFLVARTISQWLFLQWAGSKKHSADAIVSNTTSFAPSSVGGVVVRPPGRWVGIVHALLTPMCFLISLAITLAFVHAKVGPLALLPMAGPGPDVDLCYLVSPVAMAMGLLATYQLVRLVAGSFGAILAVITLACSPVTMELANNPNSHAATLCVVSWGMFLLIRWWQAGGALRAALAGFLLGFAVTIRYTEGMLLLPVLVAAALNTRWNKRSILETSLLLAWWALPVLYLVCFNLGAFGSFTGYDSTNESTGFTLQFFQTHWEVTLREMYNTGLFFILPPALVGLVLICFRHWKMGLLLASWIVPSLLLYTAYYWAPDGQTIGYLRFYLTIFPALAMVTFWLLMRVMPLALAVMTTIARGVDRTQDSIGATQNPSADPLASPRRGQIAIIVASAIFAIFGVGILLGIIGDERWQRTHPLLRETGLALLPPGEAKAAQAKGGAALAAANVKADGIAQILENADDIARLRNAARVSLQQLPIGAAGAAALLAGIYLSAGYFSRRSALRISGENPKNPRNLRRSVLGSAPGGLAALGTGLLVLVSAGIGVYSATPDLESNAGAMLQPAIAANLLALDVKAPDDALVFGEEAVLQHLQFIRNYQVYNSRQFTTAYIQTLAPERIDPNAPQGFQPERAELLYRLFQKYTQEQLQAEQFKIIKTAVAQGRHVYLIVPSKQAKNALPAKEFRLVQKIEWQPDTIAQPRWPRAIHWQGEGPVVRPAAPAAPVLWGIYEVFPVEPAPPKLKK